MDLPHPGVEHRGAVAAEPALRGHRVGEPARLLLYCYQRYNKLLYCYIAMIVIL